MLVSKEDLLVQPALPQPARSPQHFLGEVRKIAVLRANGIGDLIFTLPALNALRSAFPQAEIVLLGLDWHAQFLTGRSGPIDRVEVVPDSRGISLPEQAEEDPEQLENFFRRMHEENFDLAFQMHGGGRYSNPFVKRLGARLTVGLRTPDAIELDFWVPYIYFQSEVLRYLEVVSLVGATHTSLEARIPVMEQDLDEAERWVPEISQPLAILHPGAGDPRRRWPMNKFAEVGNTLAWAGAHVVVIGTEQERELDEGVVNAMLGNAQNLCGKLTLGGLVGLLSRAQVVVSNDSGPLHLAEAVGTPTVGIYWCGNMITAGPITTRIHRTMISWQLECPVCGLNCTRNNCEHQVSFVSEVSKEEVTASALEMLKQIHTPVRMM